MTSVECVQCGTRNEVASEAATGMQNGSSATACSACGASLDTPQKDAPLNEIFSDFERTFHPTVNLGHPSESSGGPSEEPSASASETSGSASPSPASESAAEPETQDVSIPEPPSLLGEAIAASPIEAAPPAAESTLDELADREPPSVAALDAVPPAAPTSEREDELALSSERIVESSSRIAVAPPTSPWNASNLRASVVDSEWSTPTASEPPLAAEASDAFAPVASDRPPSEPFASAEPLQSPESVAALPIAEAAPTQEAQPISEAAPLSEPAPPQETPAMTAAASSPEASPAASAPIQLSEADLPPPSKGPPPPPAWAFANSDPEDSALARALRETAQLRRETGSRDVYPAATFVEAAASGTMQIGAVTAAERAGAENEPARQPSIADAEHPSLADDDSNDPIALDAAHHSSGNMPSAAPRAETTQRLDAIAPRRLASDAPVVSSLDSPSRSVEPAWGNPGSKRRSQVLAAGAALAVIGSFFLGRSTVSSPPPQESVAAAKAEALPAPPAALPAPPSEKPAQSEEQPGSPSAAAPAVANAEPAPVVVLPGKNKAAALSSNNGPAFDPQAAGRAIADAAARASSCRRLDQPSGRATITITFGPSGKVSTANIYGLKFPSASVRNCMGSMLYQARVPAFTGAPVTVKKSLKI